MNDTLLSASEAARQFKVSRRSISRAIEDGRLKRHGHATRGRWAGCLHVDDLRRLFPLRTKKRQVDSSRAPAIDRLFDNLEALRVNDGAVDPVFLVVCVILVATHKNSDVDFLAYCASLIVERNGSFIRRLLGENIPDAYNEFPHPFAAGLFRERLRDVAHDFLRLPDGRATDHTPGNADRKAVFKHALHVLAYAISTKHADFEIVVSFDPVQQRAEILLEPTWWRAGCNASRLQFGPDYGFRRSVITAKRLVGPVYDRLATKLAASLYPPFTGNRPIDALRLEPDHDKAAAFDALTHLENPYDLLNSKVQATRKHVSDLFAALNMGVPDGVRITREEMHRLSSRLVLLRAGRATWSIGSVDIARAADLKYHANLDGESEEQGSKQKNNLKTNDEADTNAASEQIVLQRDKAMQRVVAEVFGVSRQIMAHWLESGASRKDEAVGWLSGYRTEFEALIEQAD